MILKSTQGASPVTLNGAENFLAFRRTATRGGNGHVFLEKRIRAG